MKIKLLGAHNTESKKTRHSCLLVDNILALDAGGLTSNLSIEEQQKLKAVLLTHQHYDHIRDIPALAMNLYLAGDSINIYSTPPVYDILTTHLADGVIYPNFLEQPKENPTIKFTVIEPLKPWQVEDYSILAVPVNHSVPTVGYQVTSPDSKTLLYTSDTGPGLSGCWEQVLPRLLVIELTTSNRFTDFARESGHLTPSLLKQELISFRELKGYLPQVITVHMNPPLEEEIKAEIATVADELNGLITLGYEGMEISL
ncbi:MBL fold metallo-hydrolase [Chloroflexota bacterium]